MFTCRRCICKGCVCENCNCKYPRSFTINQDCTILWAIGGVFISEFCKELSNKFQYIHLSLDSMLENEFKKADKADSKQHNVGELLKDAISEKNEATTYLIESTPNIEYLEKFENSVGPITKILYFKTTDRNLKDEFLEEILKSSANKRQDKVETNEKEDMVNEPVKEKKKKCCKKSENIHSKSLKKLQNFQENVVKIKEIYKENFKVVKEEPSYLTNAELILYPSITENKNA